MASPTGSSSQPQLYRASLTPLLHRRFTASAWVLLLVCWVEAVILGDKSSWIWSWLPLGPVGIRTFLLFIPALSIYIVRVANLHFGLRTAPSAATGVWQHFVRKQTPLVFGAYVFTAWFFYQVYLWSASQDADLGLVTELRPHERPRLNERPIFLRTHLLLLGVYQAVYHIAQDVDRVKLPKTLLITEDTAFKPTTTNPPPLRRVRDLLPALLIGTCKRISMLTFANFFLYSLFLRSTAWSWGLSTARVFHSLPPSVEPPTIPPFHYTLIIRSFTSSILIGTLWDISNVIFDNYVAQAPLKKGKPLTDNSKDPNGRILNGLASKKELVRTFAFWELLTIAQGFEDRRKAIFADLDRAAKPTWTQILDSAMDAIDLIKTRITDKKAPPPEMTVPKIGNAQVEELPRLSAPIQQGTIFSPGPKASSRTGRYSTRAGTVAKSFGQSPTNQSPLEKVLYSAWDKMLTQEQKKKLQPENILALFSGSIQTFLKTPLGIPFRQTFALRSRAKVLGVPTSDLDVTIHAMGSITLLAVASLKDDPYGTVYKDVPRILRTFVNVTGALIKFLVESPVHWTDVEFNAESGKKIAEIEELVGHLQANIRFLVGSFEMYASDLSLSEVEMREARKAAGLPVA